MDFKNMGIKCPNCETLSMYEKDKFSGYYLSHEGDKIGWDDEFYAQCMNKDCKLEFLVDTRLGEEEKKFVQLKYTRPFSTKELTSYFKSGRVCHIKNLVAAPVIAPVK